MFILLDFSVAFDIVSSFFLLYILFSLGPIWFFLIHLYQIFTQIMLNYHGYPSGFLRPGSSSSPSVVFHLVISSTPMGSVIIFKVIILRSSCLALTSLLISSVISPAAFWTSQTVYISCRHLKINMSKTELVISNPSLPPHPKSGQCLLILPL